MESKDVILKFLLPEPPLQVLPSLAIEIGLHKALVLQQLHYWLSKSTHRRDGYTWIYNTYEDWSKQFPFWTDRTIRSIFLALEQKGLVVSKMYDEADGNRRKWYRIDYNYIKLPIRKNLPHHQEKSSSSIIDTENNYINIYTQVLDLWNSKKIIIHKQSTDKIKRAINGKLRDKYTVEDITRSIENYAKILQDDSYFFKYKWTLADFLQRGFEKFLDWDTAHGNYTRDKSTKADKMPDGEWYDQAEGTWEFWNGGKLIKKCNNEKEYIEYLKSKGVNIVESKVETPAYTPPTYEEIQEQIKKGERKVWDF